MRCLCDRRTGLGADGLLLGAPGAGEPFGLRIFNPDGGEAERSGNGLRIYARFLVDEGAAPADGTFRIRIPAGVSEVRMDGGAPEVDMGVPRFPARAELQVQLRQLRRTLVRVSLGNPHAVLHVPGTALSMIRAWGPAVAGDPRFPSGVNVTCFEVLSPGVLSAQVWERGAGWTPASGSCATAAAATARRLGLAGDAVEVRMPGGSLHLRFDPRGRAWLRGPVTRVCEARPDPAWRQEVLHGRT